MRKGARAGLFGLAWALSLSHAGIASAGDRLIDRFGGGGMSRSPDGRWTIWSKPSPQSRDGDAPAIAYLRGPRVARRLLDYDRLLGVVWATDRRHVLVNLVDIDWQRLEVHDLGARTTVQPGKVQADINRQMAVIRPALQDTSRQNLAFGRIGRDDCVTVEQAGTPRGRDEGSFVTRAASFRIDFRRQKAIRIARCPSARG